MPYTKISQLPAHIRERLSDGAQQIYLEEFNRSVENGVTEYQAFYNAWNAAVRYVAKSNGKKLVFEKVMSNLAKLRQQEPQPLVKVTKADQEKRIVYGIVYEPEEVDTDGDFAKAAEIEEAAHNYLMNSRIVGAQHGAVAKAEVVESYIAPSDIEFAGQPVKKGSWVVAVKVHDEDMWAKVKKGEYTGFSMGGYADADA